MLGQCKIRAPWRLHVFGKSNDPEWTFPAMRLDDMSDQRWISPTHIHWVDAPASIRSHVIEIYNSVATREAGESIAVDLVKDTKA